MPREHTHTIAGRYIVSTIFPKCWFAFIIASASATFAKRKGLIDRQ